ncbi:MAG: molybdopterin cofactor-binding domain-containing protein [Bryobacteraceae bacterium]
MLEAERYELFQGPAYRFTPDRRDFFKILGGGIVVLLMMNHADGQESGRRGGGNAIPKEAEAWMHIGENGTIQFFTGKVEVGQNSRTALTQAVAEELHAPVQSVEMVMGDTDLVPFDMGTFGSRTTPTMAPQLRRVAIAAREWLLDLAAEEWHADRATLKIENGRVQGASGRSAAFGELTKGKNLVREVGAGAVSKPRCESVAKVNGRDMVTGQHRYTSDIKRPGMLYGRILRPSAFDGKLVSIDATGAEKFPGVQVVRDGNFVGIVSAEAHVLPHALAAIQSEWKAPSQPGSKDLFTYLRPAPAAVDATYTIAYIAHVPLEPRAAVAEWAEGRLTVWTGTQRPFGVREELAQAFQIPESQIRVMVPDTGSGYGGKHTGECAIEAARLAKATGKPVKLVWTREEEFTWAYFRPAGVIDIRSAANKDGILTKWEFHNYNSGGSGINTPYEVAHKQVQFHDAKSPLRQGSYRGLAATANHFARESHMDDMARTAEIDPLEFRYRNLKDARMHGVLEAAAKQFGWGKSKPRPNHGFGIACGFEKGGYVASCAEVSVDQAAKRIRVERVVTAFECGAIVNPQHLKNQVEGAVVQGLGGALFEAIEFEDGKILNGKLSRYRVPRFSDLPKLETVLVDRKDIDSAGAGETPIVALAPSIGNAVYNAVGVRLRSLPMSL